MTQQHQCNFQEEILALVKNSGETNQILKNIDEKFAASFQRQEKQQEEIFKKLESQQDEIKKLQDEISVLKNFRNNIIAIAGVVGAIGASLLHYIGSFIHNWWINK